MKNRNSVSETDTENVEALRAEAISDIRRQTEGALVKNSSVYAAQVKSMSEIYGKGTKKYALDQTQRILIALGMAIYGGSESAVEWTVTRALNHGANEQMIRETIDIALLNGGTFTVSNARFAYNALGLRKRKPRGS